MVRNLSLGDLLVLTGACDVEGPQSHVLATPSPLQVLNYVMVQGAAATPAYPLPLLLRVTFLSPIFLYPLRVMPPPPRLEGVLLKTCNRYSLRNQSTSLLSLNKSRPQHSGLLTHLHFCLSWLLVNCLLSYRDQSSHHHHHHQVNLVTRATAATYGGRYEFGYLNASGQLRSIRVTSGLHTIRAC